APILLAEFKRKPTAKLSAQSFRLVCQRFEKLPRGRLHPVIVERFKHKTVHAFRRRKADDRCYYCTIAVPPQESAFDIQRVEEVQCLCGCTVMKVWSEAIAGRS